MLAEGDGLRCSAGRDEQRGWETMGSELAFRESVQRHPLVGGDGDFLLQDSPAPCFMR